MKDTDSTPPVSQEETSSAESKDPKKTNAISGTMWIWFIIALATFFGLTYKEQIIQVTKDASAEDSQTTETPTEVEPKDKSEVPGTPPAILPTPPSTIPVVTTPKLPPAPSPPQTPIAFPPRENGQLLSSLNGRTKLLLLTESTGLKCSINATAGQTQAQFQLVEIQALHRTPPAHVATLPAELGTIKLYLVQEIQEHSYPDGTTETRIQGVNLTAEGQTQTQYYRLQENALTLLTPEEINKVPAPTSITTTSPALYMLQGR